MSQYRRICAVTGSRSDYGLLFILLKELQVDPAIDFRLVITGSHLSPSHGLTYREIEQDGFIISDRVDMLLSTDSRSAISKSVSLGIMGFAEVFSRIKPDIVVVLGDRYEIFASVVAAHLAGIPVAHIHGGESTTGVIDEAFRHCITKMSHIHFVVTDDYKKRVVQLGEHPDSVHVIGVPGLAYIESKFLHSKEHLEMSLGLKLKEPVFLVAFYPETVGSGSVVDSVKVLLGALDQWKDAQLIFILGNADVGSYGSAREIIDYVNSNKGRAFYFLSLNRTTYLSLLSMVQLVIGNSSSGIIEAPSFRVPTVNIGRRQEGRLRATSIIDCSVDKEAIKLAIDKAFSRDFQIEVYRIDTPYKRNLSSIIIMSILRNVDLTDIMRKDFYDVGG